MKEYSLKQFMGIDLYGFYVFKGFILRWLSLQTCQSYIQNDSFKKILKKLNQRQNLFQGMNDNSQFLFFFLEN